MSIKDSLTKIAKGVEGGAKSVVKGVGGSAKSVARKSGDIVEITRLNREISSVEEEIDKLTYELGKNLFSKFKEGGSFGNELDDMCSQITEMQAKILNTKEKISELKGFKVCPKCRTELDISIAYCPMCGTKQSMPAKELIIEQAEPEVTECELEECVKAEGCDSCNCMDQNNEDGACDCEKEEK